MYQARNRYERPASRPYQAQLFGTPAITQAEKGLGTGGRLFGDVDRANCCVMTGTVRRRSRLTFVSKMEGKLSRLVAANAMATRRVEHVLEGMIARELVAWESNSSTGAMEKAGKVTAPRTGREIHSKFLLLTRTSTERRSLKVFNRKIGIGFACFSLTSTYPCEYHHP